jgi:hypothetical protein
MEDFVDRYLESRLAGLPEDVRREIEPAIRSAIWARLKTASLPPTKPAEAGETILVGQAERDLLNSIVDSVLREVDPPLS